MVSGWVRDGGLGPRRRAAEWEGGDGRGRESFEKRKRGSDRRGHRVDRAMGSRRLFILNRWCELGTGRRWRLQAGTVRWRRLVAAAVGCRGKNWGQDSFKKEKG